jgi:hypothetical protein
MLAEIKALCKTCELPKVIGDPDGDYCCTCFALERCYMEQDKNYLAVCSHCGKEWRIKFEITEDGEAVIDGLPTPRLPCPACNYPHCSFVSLGASYVS